MDDLQKARENFDAQVRSELRSIPVPPGLRERILTGRPQPGILWPNFRGPLLALAAAVVILGAGLFLWNRRPAEDQTFAGFQNRMTGFAVRQYSMDFFTRDLDQARQRLAAQNAPAHFQLPVGLRTAPVKGGAKLSWQGRPVSMVCFDGPNEKTLYLFVIQSGAFDSPPVPQTTSLKGLACATWTAAGHSYLLAGDLPRDQLQQYL